MFHFPRETLLSALCMTGKFFTMVLGKLKIMVLNLHFTPFTNVVVAEPIFDLKTVIKMYDDVGLYRTTSLGTKFFL